MMDNKYAVLFDLDGTLIDSFNVYHIAANHVLSQFGISCAYEELFIHAGSSGEELYTIFLKKNNVYDPSMKDDLKKTFDEKFFGMLHNVVFPKKSADTIKGLKASGYIVALCTGATRKFVDEILPDDISRLFGAIVTCDDVSHCKPNPETFLKAATEIRVSPIDCIVVGDSQNDSIGAALAEMEFVLLRNIHNTDTKISSTIEINDIIDLFDVLHEEGDHCRYCWTDTENKWR